MHSTLAKKTKEKNKGKVTHPTRTCICTHNDMYNVCTVQRTESACLECSCMNFSFSLPFSKNIGSSSDIPTTSCSTPHNVYTLYTCSTPHNIYTCIYTLYTCFNERRKEERNKQGQTNNKAKQHSTPKAVTYTYIGYTHTYTGYSQVTHTQLYVCWWYIPVSRRDRE